MAELSTICDGSTVEMSGSTLRVKDRGITAAKIIAIAASKLWGRGSAGGSGDGQEITLGTGLSMSGTTLSVSGGSGLTLVEKKTITANSTTVTFSGLNGDTDEVYLLVGRIKASATGGLVLRPNGATTNLTSAQNAVSAGSNFPGSTSTWRFLNPNSGDVYSFSATINASKVNNSVAMRRDFFSHAGGYNGSNAILFTAGGDWNETSTNITSLDIVSETATGIGDGSTLALYKYAQS